VSIAVLKPGLLTTLQDTGRPGYAHLGIGRSGAFDAPALRIANALCGNVRDACALEITLLGPTLHFDQAARIAVTGAPLALRAGGKELPMWAPVHVPAMTTLTLGAIRSGCRSYLAVRGGFDVAPVLGSRSTDVNASLGPNHGRALRTGDTLAVSRAANAAPCAPATTPRWRLDPRPWFHDEVPATLRLLPGSHADALTAESHAALLAETFHVQPDSNRTGLRLLGPRLHWREPVELVSEGCTPGLLQLPPSGQPIAFGPECPVSGGYPRIGQVVAVDLPRLAQLRPGNALRFTACTLDEALRRLQLRERALAQLETRIAARLPT
jgi:antagonist of KipI